MLRKKKKSMLQFEQRNQPSYITFWLVGWLAAWMPGRLWSRNKQGAARKDITRIDKQPDRRVELSFVVSHSGHSVWLHQANQTEMDHSFDHFKLLLFFLFCFRFGARYQFGVLVSCGRGRSPTGVMYRQSKWTITTTDQKWNEMKRK